MGSSKSLLLLDEEIGGRVVDVRVEVDAFVAPVAEVTSKLADLSEVAFTGEVMV